MSDDVKKYVFTVDLTYRGENYDACKVKKFKIKTPNPEDKRIEMWKAWVTLGYDWCTVSYEEE